MLLITIGTALLVNKVAKQRESIKLYPSNGKKATIATESNIPTPSPLKPTVVATPTPTKAQPSILNHERERVPIIVREPPRGSERYVSERRRVVSHVGSERILVEDNGRRREFYRAAAPGAMNAPSGFLKHDF